MYPRLLLPASIVLASLLLLSCAVESTPTRTPYQTPTHAVTATPTPYFLPTYTPTAAPLRTNGRGDAVLDCTLSSGNKRFTITHSGRSNFIVWLHDDQGSSELLVNDIGSYSGTVLARVGRGLFDLAPGPCVFEVTADGSWSISMAR